MKKTLVLIAALFLSHFSFSQTKLIPVQRDYKYGYAFETNGPLILPARYEDAQYFEEGLAPVKLNGKWGFINEQGVTVIPFKYDGASLFTDGYCIVVINDKHGIINKTGGTVIPCKWDNIGNLAEGLVAVEVGGKVGYINAKGAMVIQPKYEPNGISDFAGGFAKVMLGGKYTFINKTGKEIAPPKYNAVADFKEGMAIVSVDTNWNKRTSDGSKITRACGFIDATGKEVIHCQYENVGSFDNGFAQAFIDGYELKIDKSGKVVDTLARPIRRYVAPLDSTTFSGKINKMGHITLTYSKGFIKKITLNGMAVYNISTSPVNIDVKKMGLKPGSSATLKVVYTKGAQLKFLNGQDIE
jgi:hypothetical protein